MKKRKRSAAPTILTAAGVIFLCAAAYFFVHGIFTYAGQFELKHWKQTTATVIYVEKYRTSSGRSRHRRTEYDIYYQYEAGGDIYSDVIYGRNTGKKYGETFTVKYDPEEPGISTVYLEPDFGFVISGCAGGLIFGFLGWRMLRKVIER